MPLKQGPIVVVGSINMDLVTHTPRIPHAGETVLGSTFETHPGGKGANQAVAAARLGHPVAMVGRVGDDALGSQLLQGLRDAGISVEAVATVSGSSGIAVITVQEDGENCIVITPGANLALTPTELDRHTDLIRSAGVVLTQLEIPLETVQHLAAICAGAEVPLILDPAPARDLPQSLLRQVSWLTPNETEAITLLEATKADVSPEQKAQSLHAAGVNGVVLKLGEKGVYVSAPTEEPFAINAFQVQARDTTAAGDAFNGAFAVALMQGKSPQESARFAAAAAAVSVARPGAQPSMPSLPEVESLLAGQR